MDNLTPDKMVAVLRLPTSESEKVLFDRLRYLDRTERLSYAERGFISKQVHDFLLHEERADPDTGKPCTFNRWLKLACPWGYSTAFSAMRDVAELSDIPPEQLSEIPQSNFSILKQLSTAVRAEATVIEAAKTQSVHDFTATVRKSHPGQHIEAHKVLKFTPEESAVVVIEEALKQAEIRGATNRNQALEMVAAEALQTWQYEAEIEKMEAPDVEDTQDEMPVV